MSTDMVLFSEALNGGRGDLDAWLECNNEAEVRAHVRALVAAERERMLSMRVLLNACDAVGVPATEEYAALLRAELEDSA